MYIVNTYKWVGRVFYIKIAQKIENSGVHRTQSQYT
jgi:hypothetical protein